MIALTMVTATTALASVERDSLALIVQLHHALMTVCLEENA